MFSLYISDNTRSTFCNIQTCFAPFSFATAIIVVPKNIEKTSCHEISIFLDINIPYFNFLKFSREVKSVRKLNFKLKFRKEIEKYVNEILDIFTYKFFDSFIRKNPIIYIILSYNLNPKIENSPFLKMGM